MICLEGRGDDTSTWAADGQCEAYLKTIYVINADGTKLRRVTSHPERDDFPSWQPDGKHLVTVSERKGRHELFLWEIED